MFGERVRNMTLGAGYEFGIEMGSLISEEQVKAVSSHVDDAVVKGATVVAGGKARPDLGPLFFEPTVLTDVPEDAECYRDETFGPLVSIYPVADVDEAVERANDTEYGLNASVWAANQERGRGHRRTDPRRHRQRRRGLCPDLGQHRRADGWHGGVRGRPPPRHRGPAQVHRAADHRHHPYPQSRRAAGTPAEGVGEDHAAVREGAAVDPRPLISGTPSTRSRRCRTACPVASLPNHVSTRDGDQHRHDGGHQSERIGMRRPPGAPGSEG